MTARKLNYDHLAGDEKLIHYWWFMYLRANDQYAAGCARGGRGLPSQRVYKDFGDVRGTEFQAWWVRRQPLFREPAYTLRKVPDEADARDWLTNEDGLLVGVNMWAPHRELVDAFSVLLKKHRGAKYKRGEVEPEYPVTGRRTYPVLQKLKRCLRVWELRMNADDPAWKGHAAKQQWKIYYLARGKQVPDQIDPVVRAERDIETSRDFAFATTAIEGTMYGMFPVTKQRLEAAKAVLEQPAKARPHL